MFGNRTKLGYVFFMLTLANHVMTALDLKRGHFQASVSLAGRR